MRFDPLLNPKGHNAVVCLHEQELHWTSIVAKRVHLYLNLVNFDVCELLRKDLVLLVDVNDVHVAFLVGSVEFALLVIPTDARVGRLVRICYEILLNSFSGFKPLQLLIVPDREYEILLDYEENLNYADAMESLLSHLQFEKEVLVFAPLISRPKNVERPF